MDQLLDLGEELDLANAAAPALEVEARAERLPLRIMVADAADDLANFLDRPEVERAAPDERLDRVEEMLAQAPVAGGGAGADESGALPRQRLAFVIAKSPR